jgi:hypothetical protein
VDPAEVLSELLCCGAAGRTRRSRNVAAEGETEVHSEAASKVVNAIMFDVVLVIFVILHFQG